MKVRELGQALLDLPRQLYDAEVMYSNVSFEEGEVVLKVDEINVSTDGIIFLDYQQLGDEKGEVIGEHTFVTD